MAIRYELAGIGSRGVAVMIDTLLQILLFLGPVYGVNLLWKIFTNALEHSVPDRPGDPGFFYHFMGSDL